MSPSASPIAISLDPPPTSITAIVPSAGWTQRARGAHEREPRLLLAGEHAQRHAARRPPRRRPARRGSARCGSRRWPRPRAPRRPPRAPRPPGFAPPRRSRRSSRPGSRRPSPRLLPMRVNARWATSSRSLPSPASATSSRVVLLPMSMQAQIKPMGGWGASSGCEASSNSRNSPVTTNAVCSPMSTALSPIRSSAAGHEHHVHRPLARVGVVADLERERGRPRGSAGRSRRPGAPGPAASADVAALERLLRLDHLAARLRRPSAGSSARISRVGAAARGRRAGRASRCSRTGRPCARCA